MTPVYRFRNNSLPICAAMVGLWLLAPGPLLAEMRPIDSERSRMKVFAYKSGFFSAFAHDHEVLAPIASGTVDATDSHAVELTVETAKMQVLDPKVSERDRVEIQQTMLSSKVLDAAQFPEIRFRSTLAEMQAGDRWIVRGDLTLHGQTRPVELQVSGANGRYTGSVTINQTDFGIKPISLFGGTVKVKDAVRIEFEIVLSE